MVDPVTIGLVGSTLLSGLFGGKSKTQTSQPTGFNALPKAVQDAWLNVALPKITQTANRPYQSMPMQRVGAPKDIFDSQALYDLQNYSDSMGGYFSPIAGRQQPIAAPVSPMGPQLNQTDFEALIRAINPSFGAPRSKLDALFGRQIPNQSQQQNAISAAYKQYGMR